MDLPDRIPPELQQRLEDALFRELDTDLVGRLRERRQSAMTVDALERLTGVHDRGVLERVVALGVEPHTLTAVALVPLVAIAWADGAIQPGERAGLLRAAEEIGITVDTPEHELLERWLEVPDDGTRLETWIAFMRATRDEFSESERQRIGREALRRGRAIARSAGGFLGLRRVSSPERAMLRRIAEAFCLGRL